MSKIIENISKNKISRRSQTYMCDTYLIYIQQFQFYVVIALILECEVNRTTIKFKDKNIFCVFFFVFLLCHEYVKHYSLKILITCLKMKLLLKTYVKTQKIFSSLNLIVGQLTLTLNLSVELVTIHNWNCLT